jgi:hypothetical protein
VTADNGCSYTKTFEIKHYEVPVITSIQLSGNNVIIYATGSKSILYSIDGINWQASNSFNNLPTGITTFYVRFADSDCIVKKTVWYWILQTPLHQTVTDLMTIG